MKKTTNKSLKLFGYRITISLLWIMFVLMYGNGAIDSNTGNFPLSVKVLAFLLSTTTLFLLISACVLVSKIRDCSKKTYIYIALFILCNITFGLNLMISLKLFSFFYTSLLAQVTYNLYISVFILYMVMNNLKHLQLIYWEIRGIKGKSLWAIATMRSILLISFTVFVLVIPLLRAFIPSKALNVLVSYYLLIISMIFAMFLRAGKESLIESKITNFVQKIITFNGRWPRLEAYAISMIILYLLSEFGGIWISNVQKDSYKNYEMENELSCILQIFLFVATVQAFFLKCLMDPDAKIDFTTVETILLDSWGLGKDDESKEQPNDIE
ncbi:uncharacterized protein LOC129565144 [Sitodiplosis mosellana]|uniref:uncharacterized protein LOC129565144 n=1 Tax=Sitodiplosis mosellana TaxID=263140 RepID=UPI002444C03B|nr:uncharacterized protein LOC129565144 [Sitodiplosis mosellana]